MADPLRTPSNVEQVRKTRSPLTNGTFVLIADGEKALLCENIGDAEYPVLEVRRETQSDNPPTRSQGTDRPGRFNDGPAVQRSAVADTDWHRLAKDRFADDLAAMLYRRAHAHRFERLILAAAPQTLGALRKTLHREVAERVVAEVDKDLTNLPPDAMARSLSAALG